MQRRLGETALKQGLGIVYPKPFNPLHHLRPLSHSDNCIGGGGGITAACCGGSMDLDAPVPFVTDLETLIWEESKWRKVFSLDLRVHRFLISEAEVDEAG